MFGKAPRVIRALGRRGSAMLHTVMTDPIKPKVAFKVFRASGVTPWDKLFETAVAFASTLKPDLLLNISHSSDSGSGTVVVWYREETLGRK